MPEGHGVENVTVEMSTHDILNPNDNVRYAYNALVDATRDLNRSWFTRIFTDALGMRKVPKCYKSADGYIYVKKSDFNDSHQYCDYKDYLTGNCKKEKYGFVEGKLKVDGREVEEDVLVFKPSISGCNAIIIARGERVKKEKKGLPYSFFNWIYCTFIEVFLPRRGHEGNPELEGGVILEFDGKPEMSVVVRNEEIQKDQNTFIEVFLPRRGHEGNPELEGGVIWEFDGKPEMSVVVRNEEIQKDQKTYKVDFYFMGENVDNNVISDSLLQEGFDSSFSKRNNQGEIVMKLELKVKKSIVLGENGQPSLTKEDTCKRYQERPVQADRAQTRVLATGDNNVELSKFRERANSFHNSTSTMMSNEFKPPVRRRANSDSGVVGNVWKIQVEAPITPKEPNREEKKIQ